MSVRKYTKADSNKKVGKYLTVSDLWVDPKITDTMLLDDALVFALDAMRDRFGKPVKFGSPHALYRTAATNKGCGGAKSSKHVQGIAADFSIAGVDPVELAKYAEQLGMGGIGVYKNASHIHMDTRNGKARWWLITSNSSTPGFGGVPVSFKQGNRSPAIAQVQKALNNAGFICGTADGVFGAKTTQALKAYQSAKRLTADGVFGRKTNQTLKVFEW